MIAFLEREYPILEGETAPEPVARSGIMPGISSGISTKSRGRRRSACGVCSNAAGISASATTAISIRILLWSSVEATLQAKQYVPGRKSLLRQIGSDRRSQSKIPPENMRSRIPPLDLPCRISRVPKDRSTILIFSSGGSPKSLVCRGQIRNEPEIDPRF